MRGGNGFLIHNEGKLKITRCETGNLENRQEMSQSSGCSTIWQWRSPEWILSLLFKKKSTVSKEDLNWKRDHPSLDQRKYYGMPTQQNYHAETKDAKRRWAICGISTVVVKMWLNKQNWPNYCSSPVSGCSRNFSVCEPFKSLLSEADHREEVRRKDRVKK